MLALLLLVATQDLTVVHTGEDGAYQAAQVVAKRVGAPLVTPAMTTACMHNPGCDLRPQTTGIVVVTVYSSSPGWVVHLELVARDGSTSAVEDVRTSTWDVMPAMVSAATDRLLGIAASVPPATAAAAPAPVVIPADTDIGDLWEIGTTVATIGCCAIGGIGLVGLMLSTGTSAQELASGCGAACTNIGDLPAFLCGLPLLAAEACVASIELLGTLIECLNTLNACLSCQIPSAAVLPSSMSLVTQPTEGGPPTPSEPRPDAMRF